MKVTKKLREVVGRSSAKALTEDRDMELPDLIKICREYADLGDAVGGQLWDIVQSAGAHPDELQRMVDEGELNANALRPIERFLQKVSVYGEVGEHAKEYIDAINEFRAKKK